MRIFILVTIMFVNFVFANSDLTTSSLIPSNNYFIENQGQWPDEVKYLARIGGMDAWITNEGIVYDYYLSKIDDEELIKTEGHVVKTVISDSGSTQKFFPQRKINSHHNYIIGNEGFWIENVSLYSEILVEDLYDGINIRYYFDEGFLRYDFILEPGSDVFDIGLFFEGNTELAVLSSGEMEIDISIGKVIHKDILAYQEDGEVACRFVQKSKNIIGFEIIDYDKSKELIIDPIIYSTFIGGSGADYSNALAIDSDGNSYITGRTFSADYPTTTGAYSESINGGSYDAFISKLNADGSGLIYSTYIGGSGDEIGYDIQVDENGNAYMSGYTSSTDYPTTIGAYDRIYNGGAYDIVITKLNPTGSALVYSTFIGGANDDYAFGIDLDLSGNMFVSGHTSSTDFPTTSGAYDQTYSGGTNDVIAVKLNSSGTALIYSTFIGGTADDVANKIVADDIGEAYLTGSTESSNYPVTSGAYDESYNGNRDILLTKLTSDGSSLIYSTYIGGSEYDHTQCVDVDRDGNAYLTGLTASQDFPTTEDVFDNSYTGGSFDIFATKVFTDGDSLVYSTYIGGGAYEKANNIKVDELGFAYIVGFTSSTSFPITSNADDATYNGGAYDAVGIRLGKYGEDLLYSSYLGGSGADRAYGLAVDTNNTSYVSGYTESSDFPVTSGAYNETYNGGSFDAFITKMNFFTPTIIAVPDDGLREIFVTEHAYGISDNGDGTITVPDLTLVDSITITAGLAFGGPTITDLSGLEKFKYLVYLNLYGDGYDSTSLYIDNLAYFSSVIFLMGRFENIEIDNCQILERIEFNHHSCSIQILDISNCNNLSISSVGEISVDSVLIENCEKINQFGQADDGWVGHLKFVNCPNLENIDSKSYNMKSLILENCPSISEININFASEFEEFYVSNPLNLKTLVLGWIGRATLLNSLDLANYISLEYLSIASQEAKEGATSFKELWLGSNQDGLTNNTQLTRFLEESIINGITGLDISNSTLLGNLDCSGNPLPIVYIPEVFSASVVKENYTQLAVLRDTIVNPVIETSQTGAYELGNTGAIVNFIAYNGNQGRLLASTPSNPSVVGSLPTGIEHIRGDKYWSLEKSGLSNFTYHLMLDLSSMEGLNIDSCEVLYRPDNTAPWEKVTEMGKTVETVEYFKIIKELNDFGEFAISGYYPYDGSWTADLLLTDNGGINRTISFGLNSNATDSIDSSLGEESLPPPPPTGAVDARFILPVEPSDASTIDYRNSTNSTVFGDAAFNQVRVDTQ